jgi:hypothetical protein
MATKLPNGHRKSQLFSFQGPPKFTQICSFGLKTYHLAALLQIVWGDKVILRLSFAQ